MTDTKRPVDDQSELRDLNARFINNFVTNDVAGHDAILHPEFLCITSGGVRVDRERYLIGWATGFDPDVITYWDYRDESITVAGDVALVRSTNKHVIVADGAGAIGMTAYTDTYVREAEGWLCLQAQLTTVTPEHYPPDDTIVKQYVRGDLQP